MPNQSGLNLMALLRSVASDTWNLPWPRLEVPAYQEISLGPWSLRRIDLVPQRGYFQDVYVVTSQYTLSTPDYTWMSTAPVDIESQAPHVAAAQGHVVVMGAGMGLALYNILPKSTVTRVTLVEREPQVMDLLWQATDIEHWPGVEKLNIEIMDAFDYCPSERVNHLYVDIWPKTGDPQALPDTQRIQAQVQADSVGWWTQEVHFLRWLENKGWADAPSLEQYREWAKEIHLPLIEQDHPAYMHCIAQVARSLSYQMIRRQDQNSQK